MGHEFSCSLTFEIKSPNMTIVDAHQHFWHPARGDYNWMPANHPIISRTYTPADLTTELHVCNVEKTVLVQAAPSIEETEYLLGIADATPHVSKVVGWIDFEDAEQIQSLKRIAAHPKLAGVRPMIEAMPNDDWMLRKDIQWAFQAIVDHDLTLDCLGLPRHLANFHTLLKQYPDMRVVVDHCMKPQIRNHSEANFSTWADGITRLADDSQAYCKLSGLVTETDTDWSAAALKPYTDHILNTFGPERVMWGSDWPVLRLRCEYRQWFELAQSLVSERSKAEKEMIFGNTAAAFYRLHSPNNIANI